MPCYNEEANIARVVADAVRHGTAVARDVEVLVVDDGSRDKTAAILRDLARTFPQLRVVHHEVNKGYGAAVARGLVEARCPWVFFTDSDGQFDLAQLAFLPPLLQRHDVVTGYRLVRKDPPWRRLNGRLWTSLVNSVLRMRARDADCAFKVFPRWFLQSFTIESKGALLSAELLARATHMGLSMAQVGVTHLPREAGSATGGNLRVIVRAFKELTRLHRRIIENTPRDRAAAMQAASERATESGPGWGRKGGA